jgi:hypothetical protein
MLGLTLTLPRRKRRHCPGAQGTLDARLAMTGRWRRWQGRRKRAPQGVQGQALVSAARCAAGQGGVQGPRGVAWVDCASTRSNAGLLSCTRTIAWREARATAMRTGRGGGGGRGTTFALLQTNRDQAPRHATAGMEAGKLIRGGGCAWRAKGGSPPSPGTRRCATQARSQRPYGACAAVAALCGADLAPGNALRICAVITTPRRWLGPSLCVLCRRPWPAQAAAASTTCSSS